MSEAAAPLLDGVPDSEHSDDDNKWRSIAGYVEGCPGCQVEQKKAVQVQPPRKDLFILAVVMLATSLTMSSLFPFLYFMVRDFHVTSSDTDIGRYAGYIGSAFMFGRFLSSVPWGVVADKYGRKPVLLIGTASVVVFNTIFGFSKNFWLALMARFFLGITNGIIGTVPACASELCSEEHQPLGLSIVGTMWGVGLIIGPAIGGYLAQPSEKYPSVFPTGSLFDSFPYALPCVCISAFALAALMIGFWLPESIHVHGPIPTPKVKHEDDNGENGTTNNEDKMFSDKGPQISDGHSKPLWKNHGWIAAVCLYCLWGLHDMAYSEIFSLWAVSPTSYGGLGFSTFEVGNVLAVSGAALLIFQIFIFPMLAKIFGVVSIARYPIVLSIPLIAVYPLIAKLTGAVLWIVLILAAVIKILLSVSVVTGSFIMINNSVVSLQRGVANNMASGFMSLFRALGPAAAGAIFSWSEQRMDARFLPGMWMVFTVLALLALLALPATLKPFLPSSLERPITEGNPNAQTLDGALKRAASFHV